MSRFSFKGLKDRFSSIPNSSLFYGVLKPCYRCTYQKSNEPILIISKTRGPRIIVNLNKVSYVRQEECIGYASCGKCFDQALLGNLDVPCKWKSLSKL
jgi:hypothetical protein